MMEVLAASWRATIDIITSAETSVAYMRRFGAHLIHARSLAVPPSHIHRMNHQMPVDNLQELKFNILLPRKWTFVERERLKFSARDDFDVAFAVHNGLAAPLQALTARMTQTTRLGICSGFLLMTK